MRLGVFSPLPPIKSGIADYTVELLDVLARRHAIDVFVASREERTTWAVPGSPFAVRDAHDFVWAHRRAPYDLLIYQMGNAWCHDFMWPYLFRWPGLVVLHDAHLHHARAWSLMRRDRREDYRAELAFNHPALPVDAAEIGLGGFPGPIYYFWPMLRSVVASARAVAVHNPVLADDLAAEFPGAAIYPVPMGVGDRPAAPAAAAAVRARHGLSSTDIVCAAFGAVTPEKGIEAVVRAVAVTRRYCAQIRLLLVGQTVAHFDAQAVAQAHGLADRLTVTGFVDADQLPAYLAASDIVLSLRWPSARETSGSWLRAIAAGRPTVVTDLAQQTSLPTLDPRSWTVVHAQPTLAPLEPIAVSIDVLDEQHSLTMALKRLSCDAALRARLGTAARAHWAAGHTLDHMASGYELAIAEAASRPDPAVALPPHLRPDPSAWTRRLLADFPDLPLFPT